ncbi:haloacid dehalogenase superfamily, subfamily IA, variant 1 with third motif having Dx(3-4)D or Dx(3-4)E [Pseudonocardia thermophila]|uniref:Haloacid dehalogenase superfamily, subfamily IA, variant 1 with third motif having Dx(3-4)D or Dx(3-4)E n=1 Tax=Pseudonocardia thermophila TaxID=1848 RepID=A0A1M6SZI4_PSETH|nr:HAD family hydrolase [Pseudonocardia thermophila]SHK50125.1 haloacid dehalogenase superfamily, subfamily IA, variant 1 with third motif having Dx(3-4)D or Dx(3-4)E [Pseudonocardia thermophila]
MTDRADTAHPDTAHPDTAIVDVDGTLVDTNYHHALAWFRAFRRFGVTLPVWRLHRAIGMGGDQLVPAVAGNRFEDDHGDAVREAWKDEFDPLMGEVRPFGGVCELLTAFGESGLKVVLASSGAPEHVDAYLDLFDGRRLADAWTTSEDVDRTKPEPDLITAALDRVRGEVGIVIGDSVWDFRAAERAGQRGYAIRTGGFSESELREAGARNVFESLPELHQALPRILG